MEHKYITKEQIKQIPKLPGIYKMLDSRGVIIYIGKSKCLQKRVQSYFVKTPKWDKVNRMISLLHRLEYVVTDTHLEARLLECSLIKEHKPHFNCQMKHDRNYFFIKVEDYNKYNPLSIVEERTEHCFGPFRSKHTMSEFLLMLKNIYPITRNGSGYEFDYHIFPISLEKDVFDQNKALLFELFTSEDQLQLMLEALQSKLEEAASLYRYEMASIYRDMIFGFQMLKSGLNRYKSLASRNILLKYPLEHGCYKLFYIVKGRVVHSMLTEALTADIRRKFICTSQQMIPFSGNTPDNEKEWMDYRDIIYSELSDLPDELLELL